MTKYIYGIGAAVLLGAGLLYFQEWNKNKALTLQIEALKHPAKVETRDRVVTKIEYRDQAGQPVVVTTEKEVVKLIETPTVIKQHETRHWIAGALYNPVTYAWGAEVGYAISEPLAVGVVYTNDGKIFAKVEVRF